MKKEQIKKETKNAIFMVVGCAIIAFTFNALCLSNNYITGGVSAIGLILNYLLEVKVSTVLVIGNILVILLGICTLGFKDIYRSIIGSVVYTAFMYLFEYLYPYIQIDLSSTFLSVVTVGCLFGIGCTLVYIANYTTGGVDVLGLILNRKLGVSFGKGAFIINSIILLTGAYIFGLECLIIALIIRFIEALIIDNLYIGISDSKVMFINTKEQEKVKEMIIHKFESGISEIVMTSGYTNKNDKVLMSVVPSEKYLLIKKEIIKIDKNAFITILDAYEVYGGTNRYKLPFHDLRI